MTRLSSRKSHRNGGNAKALWCASTAALAAIAWGALPAHADTLIKSFETGGFDFDGDTGAGITYATQQTTGVTDGTYSLRVSSPQSWWTNFGFTNLTAADMAANTTLKFDITTSTGVSFVPIFHTDPSPGPGDGGYYQYDGGIYIPPSASTQTFTFNYTTAQFNNWSPVTGLPAATTNYTLQLQGSTGNAVDFYIDNIRLAPPDIVPGPGPAEWAVNGSGNWMTASNWNPSSGSSVPPGASNSVITFGTNSGAITTASQITVALTQPATAAILTFDKGGGGYKIDGTFALNVTGNITVNSGSHTINTPVNQSSNTSWNIAAGSSLTLANLAVGGYGQVVKTGSGSLTVDKLYNCSVDIQGGTLSFSSSTAQANGFIYALSVADGATFNTGGASLRVNGIYTAGTINTGSGGTLSCGFFSDFTYYGTLTGAGNVVVGGEDTNPHTNAFAGQLTYTGSTLITNGNTAQLMTNLTRSSSITVNGNGSKLVLVSDGNYGRVVKTGLLSVTGTGTKVDMGDGKLITSSPAGSWNGSAYTDVTALIASGRGSGNMWDGATGIVTTQSAAVGSNLYSIGVARASDVNPSTASATALWAGQTITGSDTLVMYTYGGDANLDGKINVDDYIKIDSGIAAGLTGWANGDFNYDGKVNIDDYTTVIDANIGNQSGVIPTAGGISGGGSSGVAAVPEPAALTLISLFAVAGATRRRRGKQACSL